MERINIGEVVARERRSRGITQEALAQHMGVTKAAVSKWELGQSMPDVALLPRLASYFGLSLDALFDYHADLSRSEVSHIYREIWEELQRDESSAWRMLLDASAEHYSSWNLLLSLAGLLASFIARATGAGDVEAAGRYREKLFELCERVEDNASDVETQMSARQLHAGWLVQTGATGVSRAISLLEPYTSRTGSLEVLLASMYDLDGQRERASALRRGVIRHALLDTVVCTSLAVDQGNISAVSAMLDAARTLNELYGYADGDNPSPLVSACLAGARALIKHGACDEALDALSYMVDVLERRLQRLRALGDAAVGSSEGIAAPLHELLELETVGDGEELWDTSGLSKVDAKGTEDMLRMLAGMLSSDDEDVAPLAGNERFAALRARLARYATA